MKRKQEEDDDETCERMRDKNEKQEERLLG